MDTIKKLAVGGVLAVALFIALGLAWHNIFPTAADKIEEQLRIERVVKEQPVKMVVDITADLLPYILVIVAAIRIWQLAGVVIQVRQLVVTPSEWLVSAERLAAGDYDRFIAESNRAAALATVADAQRQEVPETLTSTYAPHFAPHDSRKYTNATPIVEDAPTQRLGDAPPAWATMLDTGSVGGGKHLMGYSKDDNGQFEPQFDDGNGLYSLIVAGLSGSGKTTTVRRMAAERALNGSYLSLCDPHGKAQGEGGAQTLLQTLLPLSPAFLFEPAVGRGQIYKSVRFAYVLGKMRLGQNDDPTITDEERRQIAQSGIADAPLLTILDEFTGLMRVVNKEQQRFVDELTAMLEFIAQECRKVEDDVMLLGQIFTAERGGGTALRDAMTAALVHRMKRRQAGMLLPEPEVARLAATLTRGQTLLYNTQGEVSLLWQPDCTPADMVRVGQMLQLRGGVPLDASFSRSSMVQGDLARLNDTLNAGLSDSQAQDLNVPAVQAKTTATRKVSAPLDVQEFNGVKIRLTRPQRIKAIALASDGMSRGPICDDVLGGRGRYKELVAFLDSQKEVIDQDEDEEEDDE